ncbi:MAG: HNH endonuclease [Gemmatimonadales bacterium]|nr:MAG: HNH endonuclease [Gemmatimonadales bacterium]
MMGAMREEWGGAGEDPFHGQRDPSGGWPHPVPDRVPLGVTFRDPFHDPVPDPFSDPDPIRDLEDRILALAAQLDAATFRLLDLVAEFDRRRGYELGGHPSTAHWLAARAGFGMNAARERVRTARALEELPLISAKMASGQLSYAKARALTRIATPGDEAELVGLSLDRSAAEVERMVRGWRLGSVRDEKAREELRYQSRTLTIVPDLDGMYRVRGVLTPEQAAMVMRGIDAAADALFREAWPGAAYENRVPEGREIRTEGARGAEESRAEESRAEESRAEESRAEDSRAAAARRRADAFALLAERALWAGFGRKKQGSGSSDAVDANADSDAGTDSEASCGCGADHGSCAAPVPISGSRAARTQVVLHVDLDVLRGEPAAAIRSRGETRVGLDRSELADGVRVTAETSRRLSCDASVVPLFLAPAGEGGGSGRRIVDIGHMKRTVSPALRRALDARDGGCRFPGCGCRFAEAHHVIHWSLGGETSLENCILLCRHHHRLVHEGDWTMVYNGTGNPVFHDPLGGTHYSGRFRAPVLPPDALILPPFGSEDPRPAPG